MKIDINKDFEEQYKNELWKGFTARELAYAGIALFVAGIIAFGKLPTRWSEQKKEFGV